MDSIATWSTWDVRCLNGVMKIPEMAEIRVALYDDEEKYYQDEFLWKNVKRFGFHHPHGKYFDIDLTFQSMTFTMVFASEGDRFVYKIMPHEKNPHIKFYIAGLFRWAREGGIFRKGNTLTLDTGETTFTITALGSLDTVSDINVSHQGLLFESSEPVYIRCNHFMGREEMEAFIMEKALECQKEIVKGEGLLEDSPQAVIKGVMWNTIYEPIYDRLCTPVSRAWCTRNGEGFGSYVLFDWDTFFAGLLTGIQDKEMAYQQVYSILQEMTEDGMVPNFGSQRGSSVDRSQPPVGAYCVLKLFRQFHEKALLEKTFDRLLQWNSWWMKNRDGNGDGMLEWGSDPYPEGKKVRYEAHNHQAAAFESGLDNSPMYDDVPFNTASHTMELTDVGLTALYAMDTWALGEIARELGKMDIASALDLEYNRVKDLMNRELWDEETGIYLNKYWDGSFSRRISPTNFYPLIAGVPTPDQAKRMIEAHLLNKEEFWGEYIIPSIAKNDKAFHDNNYWRGRIWGPMNFLVGEGIKRYHLYETAYEFARKSLKLFLKEWKEENHIHENYNAITGEGDDVGNADPVYTWGGLLAYLAISELAEAQAWGGIRFGNLSREAAQLMHYPIGGDRYTVYSGETLKVEKNGEVFMETTMPAMIHSYRQRDDTIYFDLEVIEDGFLTLYSVMDVNKIIITFHEECIEFHSGMEKDNESRITFMVKNEGSISVR